MFQLADIVTLLKDIPAHNLTKDMIGTIVMIYQEPDLPKAYEVEFCDDQGKTIALVTLKEHEIALSGK